MRPSPEAVATQPAVPRLRVGLVVDNMDWHARALARALSALGATSFPIRLTACAVATLSPTGLAIDRLERPARRHYGAQHVGGKFRGGDAAARDPSCRP